MSTAKQSNDFAVIATGGKQYVVRPGDRVTVEKLPGKESAAVAFTDVLLTVKDGAVEIGSPTIADAKVTGTLLKTAKGKRVRVVKYKPKVRYTKTTGHRQVQSTVHIDAI